MRRYKKRGQVTIFIIIAVLIVALAVLAYMFWPDIKPGGLETENPSAFIQSCLEEELEDVVETLSLQGGSLNPEHYILYQDEKIEYLCYTEKYYKTCVMQQPMLKQHIESEIESDIRAVADDCFDSLKKSYESRAYNVVLRRGGMSVELLPKRVVATFNHSFTITKTDTEKYEPFRVVLNNNLYEFVSITNSILNWEARYGDSETTLYMNYYRDLKVEKKKQTDGSTIYILTDRNNQNKFQFASRSVAWPPGYRTGDVLE
jgi:hypothetical protein